MDIKARLRGTVKDDFTLKIFYMKVDWILWAFKGHLIVLLFVNLTFQGKLVS